METETHRFFDLTYLEKGYAAMDASAWSRIQKKFFSSPDEIEDLCDHIALVSNDKDAEIAMKAGFTRCCQLDANHKPIFNPALEGFGENA